MQSIQIIKNSNERDYLSFEYSIDWLNGLYSPRYQLSCWFYFENVISLGFIHLLSVLSMVNSLPGRDWLKVRWVFLKPIHDIFFFRSHFFNVFIIQFKYYFWFSCETLDFHGHHRNCCIESLKLLQSMNDTDVRNITSVLNDSANKT